MALRFDCPKCGVELRITPRHKGRDVTCRGCDQRVDVPGQIDFRSITLAAVEDRKVSAWYVFAAYVGLITCLPAVPLLVWWLVARRMAFAREQDRPVVPAYLHARVVCIVAIAGHAATWARFWA